MNNDIARTCYRCGKTKPLHRFPKRYRYCTDCQTKYHYRWQLSLTPDQWERREKSQAKAIRRYKHKQKVERAADGRERLAFSKAIITAGLSQGMTRGEIAARAGIRPETITRIMRGTVPRVQTEKRLVAFVSELKGSRP